MGRSRSRSRSTGRRRRGSNSPVGRWTSRSSPGAQAAEVVQGGTKVVAAGGRGVVELTKRERQAASALLGRLVRERNAAEAFSDVTVKEYDTLFTKLGPIANDLCSQVDLWHDARDDAFACVEGLSRVVAKATDNLELASEPRDHETQTERRERQAEMLNNEAEKLELLASSLWTNESLLRRCTKRTDELARKIDSAVKHYLTRVPPTERLRASVSLPEKYRSSSRPTASEVLEWSACIAKSVACEFERLSNSLECLDTYDQSTCGQLLREWQLVLYDETAVPLSRIEVWLDRE